MAIDKSRCATGPIGHPSSSIPCEGQNINKSISILCEALKNDESYYYGWQANIAMAMYDECLEQGSEMPKDKLHKLCNDGARRFLNQFINS